MRQLCPGNLRHEEYIEALYALLTQASVKSGPLTLDVSATNWVFPNTILSIVTASRLWHRWTGHSVTLINIHADVHRYLERMDIFRECQPFLQADTPPAQLFDRSTSSFNLLEIIPIPSDEQDNVVAIRKALRRAKAILDTWISDSNRVNSVLTMLSELGQNIVHSEDLGYAVIQRHKQPHTPTWEQASEIHIAIADLGIGIKESLARNRPGIRNQFNSGSDFIIHALEQGVSGQMRVRGIGLHQVRNLVSKWQGELVIRSDASQIRVTDVGVNVGDDLTPIPGVQVHIVVRGTAR